MLSSPDELQAAERVRAQLDQVRVTPEQAALLERYAETWPTMTAQAAVGLAMQGLEPESDVVRKIAEAEGLELLGETRDHRGFFSKARDTVLGAVGGAFGMAGETVADAGKFGTRMGFTLFDSIQQEFIKRPLRAMAFASAKSAEQFEPDTNFSLLDDIGDTAGMLVSPKFWGGFGANLMEGDRQAGASSGRVLLDQFGQAPLDTARSLATGGEDTLGSGILPAGDIGAEAERQQQQIQIGGGGADFGDLVATTFLDPTSPEHEMWSGILQMGFDVATDPAGGALASATKAKQAAKLLGETRNLGFGMHVGNHLDDAGALKFGLVKGERNTVLPEVVRAYTRSDGFAPIADTILDPARDTYDIFQAFGGKLDPAQVRFLRESANREELAGRIDDLLGGAESILAPQKINLRAAKEPSRWRSLLPDDAINPRLGRRNAATQLDRALIAGKVDRAERARILDRWADIPSLGTPAGRAGMRDIVSDGYQAMENAMVAKGVDPVLARSLTPVYDRVAEETKYVIDTLADDPLTAHAKSRIMRSGEVEDVDLRLVSELAQEFPLPHIREISREMTGGAMNSGLFRSAYQIELATSQAVLRAWVPLQLLRGAWTVRVVGEEQVRMAVSGLDSMFRHPASAIAWVIGQKGSTDILGDKFDDDMVEFASAMARKFDAWFKSDAGKVASGVYRTTKPGEPDHWTNVAHGLKMLHDDAVVRRVAAGEETDDILRWLTSDEGAPALRDMASQFDPDMAERFMADNGAIRAYIDGFLRQGLHQATGGTDELMRLVATGVLDDVSFAGARKLRQAPVGEARASLARARGQERTNLARKVRAVLGDDNAPALAAGPKMVDATTTQQLDRLVDVGMSWLMGKPTNWLSRSPTFKQAYWQRVRQLIGGATDDVRDELLTNARDAFGRNSKELKALTKAAMTDSGDMIDDIRQLDNAAKAHALEFTKDTLYDQARRTQWVDMTAGVFVFAEAWKEIATTWARLVAQQPNILRRTQQGVEGLRDAGVFYTDPQSGDEMFTYPAGGWAAKILAGVGAVLPGDKFAQLPFETDPGQGEIGIRQTAPVESLNLFAGSVMPGVGPVVSVAAAQLIPDVPEADWLKEALFPFGMDKESGSVGDVVESGLPSYMVKLLQGWTEGKQDRAQYGNARFDVMRALAMQDPERYEGAEGQQRLLDDSKGITNNIFAIRGTEQFLGAPAAPRVEFFTRDMNGEAFNFAALTKAYWDIFKAKGGDHSETTREFISRFGVSPDLIRQGKTRSVSKRAITEPGAKWEREHKAQADAHPEVIGFFAPEDFDAQMDGSAFDRAIASGDREQLTPEVMIKLANQRTGYIAFNEAVRQLEDADLPSGSLAAAKRQLRELIAEEYPGFGETIPVKGRLKPVEVIPKLKAALEDPTLAATPAGEAMTLYFQARDRFLEAANEQFGVVTLGGKKVLPYRRALNEIAAELVREFEGFDQVWDEVLSREIKADELEEGS